MIDKLLDFFGIHRMGMLVQVASQVVKTFEQEFQKDESLQDAAIDALIEILKSHKTKKPPAQV
jgi:hypothetical protein